MRPLALLGAPAAPLMGPGRAEAETGYDLWLRYPRVESEAERGTYRKAASAIVVEGDSPTAVVIRDELRRGLSGLLGGETPVAAVVRADGAIVVGTPATSLLVKVACHEGAD